MSKYLYGNYIVTLADQFKRIIDGIMADYGFDYGDEFEVVICKALRKTLPNKYGICRGHVVSADGRKEGDDIIIFDQERFPTLRNHEKDDYSRKENIPIEAVYVYIEAKHTLDLNTFSTAFKQVSAVKELIIEREQTDFLQFDPYVNVPSRWKIEKSSDYPPYRNPVFCMILSRYATNKEGKKTDNPHEIQEFLLESLGLVEDKKFEPDLIVAGKSNTLCAGYKKPDQEEVQVTLFSPFHLIEEGMGIHYEPVIREDLTFGIALAHLLAAIDWIRLGRMPWEEILTDALSDD